MHNNSTPAHSLDDLTRRNVETIAQLEAAAQEQSSAGDRVAEAITAFCGSMTFVWANLFWVGTWICFNSIGSKTLHVDPYPFHFLALVVALEAIFLATFVLISQSRDARIADRRNHLNLQVNLLAEQENTRMLQLLGAVARKVGADVGTDSTLKLLEEATQPEKLIEQIDESKQRADGEEAKVAVLDAIGDVIKNEAGDAGALQLNCGNVERR